MYSLLSKQSSSEANSCQALFLFCLLYTSPIVKDADKSEGPNITYTYKKADGAELANVNGTATQFDAVFSALDGTAATLTPGTG